MPIWGKLSRKARINLHIKFEMPSFIHSEDMMKATKYDGTVTTPIWGEGGSLSLQG